MATGDKNTVVTQRFVDKLIDKIGKILKEQHTLVERDDQQEESIELLLEKVSSIEQNFEELTKSLALGSYPLKLARSIKVTESSISPKIVPVDLTKAQLIETYNELVAVLSGYIIPVTLTPDSYRGSNSDGIILETTVKGNYWAIATLEDKQHKYWLVPNNNLKFNIHKLKTIESLFQLQGEYNSATSEFILQEPAILSLLPDNKQWKLIQPGVLLFGKKLQSTSPQLKPPQNVVDDKQSKINKQLLSNLTTFQTTIDKLNSKISQLEIKSEISQKTYQRDKQEWLAEKQFFNDQLQKTAASQSQFANFINQGDRTKIFDSNNNLQPNLSDADLAIIKSLKSSLKNMADIVHRYHLDHHAPKQESDLIANYLLKAYNIIDTIKTNNDLIKLFEYLIALKGKVSQYDHKKYKYRWSVSLENEVLCKLQQISVLQNYQKDKLDRLLIQQALERQLQIDTVVDYIPKFTETYNIDKNLFDKYVTYTVIETKDSRDNRLAGRSETVFLSSTSKGKYWIVEENNSFYLVPNAKIRINEHSIRYTIENLFDCLNFTLEYSDFQLVKPAKVFQLSSEIWQLDKKGEIEFISDSQNKFVFDSQNKFENIIDFKNIISRFRRDYSQDHKLISDRIVAKVSISLETLAQITFHKPNLINLENTPHGKYWIIDYLGAYFLIPSEIDQITKATETSLTVARILFELVGYYPQYSSYHLIKPAIVTKLSTNQWKLQEKGKFNFS